MKKQGAREPFTLTKRVRSFAHAWRGIWVFVRTTHNAWIHLSVFAVVLLLGGYFHVSHTDWALLIFAGGMVLTAESFNTAIEIDIDLTSPEFHPYARDTKDVAAGAVLIAALTAACIGVLVFLPHLLR